jgi:uncharacterized membrane protein
MTDILISNERWRAFSNLLLTLCAALLAASVAHCWEMQTLDGTASAWILGAIVLGFWGWRVLGFLVPEDVP